MALRLPLRPVAHIMDLDDSHGPRHADDHADVDQKPFQGLPALEGAVDEHPVHADAVPDQQRQIGRDEKQYQSGPSEKQRTAYDRDCQQAAIP